jgi:hypothetical protein
MIKNLFLTRIQSDNDLHCELAMIEENWNSYSMKWLSDIKGTNYDEMKTQVLFVLRHLSYQFVSPLLNNFEKEKEKLKDLIKNSSVDFDIDKLVEYLEYSSLYDV